jgi:hypothetical protein
MIYPYLRAIVSDVCTRAGFPPMHADGSELPGHVRGPAAGRRPRATARIIPGATDTRRDKVRMNVSLLGAGAWGTALAARVAARTPCCLWARDAAQAAFIASRSRNRRYLPGVHLPDAVEVTQRPAAALAPRPWRPAGRRHTDVRPARDAAGGARRRPPVWLCKGFEAGSGLLGHEIARGCVRWRPGRAVGPQLCAGSGARPAHGAGGGQRHASVRDARCRLPRRQPAHLHQRPTSWAWKWAARSRTCWPSPPACDGLNAGG